MLLDIKPYVSQYGYWAVFGAIVLEDFGLPVPGETALILGAVFASTGQLNIILVLIVAWIGAVIGDNIGYAIGWFVGRGLVVKYGKYVLITDKQLGRAESFFHKHGAIIVVVARFIEILRQLNGIAAGTTRMRWWRFFIFNMIGAALWVCAWGLLFYYLGEAAGKSVQKYVTYFLIGGISLWVIASITFWLCQRREKNRR